MQKSLPVCDPIADAYSHIGLQFSIFSTEEEYYPWLINNYIQIYALKNMSSIPQRTGTLDFFFNKYGDWQMYQFSANPFLDYEKLSFSTLDFLSTEISLSQLLINGINHDKYACVPVDMFELSVYGAYRVQHSLHHLYVVGYDDERKVFYVYDNFKGGQYRREDIEFADLERAYKSLLQYKHLVMWSEIGGVSLFKFSKKPWQGDKRELFQVNLQTICIGIREYLLCSNYAASYSHIRHFCYGVDCYDELENCLLFGYNSNDKFVDHRAFSVMYDHKKIMLFRLRYMQAHLKIELQTYISAYEEICKQFEFLMHKIFRGNITYNINLFLSAIEILRNIKSFEISTLEMLVADLSRLE